MHYFGVVSPRITRSDDEIIDFMADAPMEENADAQKCLDLLAKS